MLSFGDNVNTMLSVLAAAATLLSMPRTVVQQEQQSRTEGILIGIAQEPGAVMPVSGLAKFEGAVFTDASLSDHRLQIKVTHPDGRIESFMMAYGANGSFQYNIGNLKEGTYRVSFTGIDGRNTVNREFRVENAMRIAQVLENKKRMLEMTQRLIERADQRMGTLPDGPDAASARDQIRRLREDHSRARTSVDRVFTAARDFAQLQSAPAEVSQPAMEVLSDISAWAQSTEQEEAEMAAFEQRTRNMPSTCDSLDTAAEGLRFVSSITSLILKPLDTIKDALKNKLKDEVIERAKAQLPKPQPGQPAPPPNTDLKFILDRIKAEVEAGYSGGTSAMIKTIPSQSREISTFIVDKLFNNYCSLIEGPARAEFSVYQPENGKLFYQYNMVLEAKLRLWTEKNQGATPQGMPFSGKLEGSVTKVDFKADVFAVEKLPKGSQLVANKVIPAPVLSKSNTNLVGSGQIMRALTPGHFAARYTGLLTEAGMKIKQENVVDDFTPLFANRVLVVAILPGALVPGVTNFKFPMQKGCWIYDRASKGAFEIPLQRSGENMILKKEVTRSETVGAGIKVNWKVTYDLKKINPPK